MWSGNTTHASIPNGRFARVTATACRNTSTCRTSVSARRSTRLTVKNTQAPGTLGRV